MEDRRCGNCTLCCKLVGVNELFKPEGKWCRFCTIGEGCRVYETRPFSCRGFECEWYMHPGLPEDLRPDNCKVVFFCLADTKICLTIVDSNYPDAWKDSKKLSPIVRRLTDKGFAFAVFTPGRKERHMILPKGRTPQSVIEEIKAFDTKIAADRKKYYDSPGIRN